MVDEWNTPGDIWRNGLFSLYINGGKVFGAVDVFELTTTFIFYSKVPINDLKINDLSIDAVSLYKNAKEYFIGESDELIDGLFDMTCTAMGDKSCYLYFIKTSSGDRLVWSIDGDNKVNEIILPSGTIFDVIDKLHLSHL